MAEFALISELGLVISNLVWDGLLGGVAPTNLNPTALRSVGTDRPKQPDHRRHTRSRFTHNDNLPFRTSGIVICWPRLSWKVCSI
jgi:hypothetical protein